MMQKEFPLGNVTAYSCADGPDKVKLTSYNPMSLAPVRASMVLSDAELDENAIAEGKKTSMLKGDESVVSFFSSSTCDCKIFESLTRPFKLVADV